MESENLNERTDQTQTQPENSPIVSQSNLPPAPWMAYCTGQQKRDWFDYAKFVGEIIGLGVLIAYTTFAALQWCQMKRATDLAQKANGDAWTLANRANQTAIDSERPWVGTTFTIQDWTVGRAPVAHVAFVNSGRRPAKITDAWFDAGDFKVFPRNPFHGRDYPAIHNVNSVGLILPNANLTNTRVLDRLTQARLDELAARQHTFFIYASIEYEDVLTHAKHWTHACWQYLPGFQNDKSGFVNCATYNDIDAMTPRTKPEN